MPLVEAKLAQAGRSEEEMRRYKGKLHDHCRRKRSRFFIFIFLLKKKNSQSTRGHTYVYITPSTLLEARSLGCILQVVDARKGI